MTGHLRLFAVSMPLGGNGPSLWEDLLGQHPDIRSTVKDSLLGIAKMFSEIDTMVIKPERFVALPAADELRFAKQRLTSFFNYDRETTKKIFQLPFH
jgi:hypothetical protein